MPLNPLYLKDKKKPFLIKVIQRYPHFDDLGWDNEIIVESAVVFAIGPEIAIEMGREQYAPPHVDPALVSVTVMEQ